MLLDVTNLFTNATNHGFGADRFLDVIPTERVVQVHLAGGVTGHGTLLDTHSAAVPEPVWALLGELLSRTTIRGALIERDEDFPPDFDDLLAEVDRARDAMHAVVPA